MATPLKSIKESLILQLKAKNADIDLYNDLIEDYIFFCTQERKMQADIRKNGHIISATSAQGKPYDKENPSVKNAVIYNRQKLSILYQMGLSTAGIDPPEDEDESGL